MASSTEESILDRIQAMLDRANHPDTNEHEREVCLRKADQMMATHKLTEAALRARKAAGGFANEKRHEPTHIKIDWVQEGDQFYPVHQQVVSALGRLAEVKLIFLPYSGQIHVFGMPDDVDYFRMMWLSAHLTFSDKLFPKWNRGASADRNIRLFVEAGYKWNYIWDQAVKEGQPFMRQRKGGAKGEMEPVPAPPGDGGWMKRALKRAYDATGEEKPRLEHGVTNYRNSYALGFAETFTNRVFSMIFAREDAARQASGGAQMVLARDVDAVQKLLDSIYPPYTLGSAGRGKSLSGNHAGARAAGATAASSVDMSGGKGGVGGRGPAGAIG